MDLYEIDTDIGKIIVPKDSVINKKNGQFLKRKNVSGKYVYVDNDNNKISKDNYIIINDEYINNNEI